MTGCSGINSSPSNSRARLVGFFFNDTYQTPKPGYRTGDVLIQFRIQRRSDSTDKPQLLEVLADVIRCNDSTCYDAYVPASILLGNIMLGQWANIEIDWDKDNSQFIFKLNNKPTVVFSYKDIWENVYPVSSPYNALGIANRLANCPAEERAMGFIDAEFENLFVREFENQ